MSWYDIVFCVQKIVTHLLSLYICVCTHTHAHTHTYTHTVCPLLSLENGNVMYSPTNRGVGSVATHTCNTGYRLSPQGGETRTCNSNISWDGQNVTCGKYTLPLKMSLFVQYLMGGINTQSIEKAAAAQKMLLDCWCTQSRTIHAQHKYRLLIGAS